MAVKKYYLIKIWDRERKKNKELDKSIETESDGFDLLQEKVIQCYETNIKNLCVPKGLRATYETIEKPKEAIKTTKTANTTK